MTRAFRGWAILSVVLLLAPSTQILPAVRADWKLAYGKGAGQVGFLNGAVQQPFQEATALGPLAFRIHRDQAWILDSLGGRVLCIDTSGRLVSAIPIVGLPKNSLLEDLALVPGPDGRIESLWVGDGADGVVRQIRVSDGEVLCRVGGLGPVPGKFQQIQQIEVGPGGRLFVGDLGRDRVSVFDASGVLLWEVEGAGSGFLVDFDGGCATLGYSEEVGYLCRSFDSKGTLRRAVHLGWGDHQNPRLWTRTEAGGLLVSFVPPGGFRGTLRLVEFSAFGQSLESVSFSPPQAMNRFLDFGGAIVAGSRPAFWLGRGDFEQAPAGKFVIDRCSWETR